MPKEEIPKKPEFHRCCFDDSPGNCVYIVDTPIASVMELATSFREVLNYIAKDMTREEVAAAMAGAIEAHFTVAEEEAAQEVAQIMTIDTLCTESHNMAKRKGWHDTERSIGEIISLCHSELSEAIEDYRHSSSDFSIHYDLKDDKPTGIPIEMADCLIRVGDMVRLFRMELTQPLASADIEQLIKDSEYAVSSHANLYPWFFGHTTVVFGDVVARIHQSLSRILETSPQAARDGLEAAITLIAYTAWQNKFDLAEAVKVKMEYNATRQYRHGGKTI